MSKVRRHNNICLDCNYHNIIDYRKDQKLCRKCEYLPLDKEILNQIAELAIEQAAEDIACKIVMEMIRNDPLFCGLVDTDDED